MADKNWWDSHKEKDTNVGNWWDKYDTDKVETIGKKITDSVNGWLRSHQNYVANYQNRTKNRKYDYSDAYVKDPNDWLMKVSEQKKAFDASADSILAYMDRYKGYLDAEWMKSVQDALSGARAEQDIVVGNASADSKWWSNFANEDEYKTAQRYDGYNKKYSGKDSNTLKQMMSSINDGEEKEWLKSYASQVDNEEKSRYDLASGQKEIDALNARLQELQQEKVVSSQFISAQMRTFGYNQYANSKRDPKEIDKEIAQVKSIIADKQSYFDQAKYIQNLTKWNSVANNADFAKKSQYVENFKYGLTGKPEFTDDTYAYVNNPTVEDKRPLGAGTVSARNLIDTEDAFNKWDNPFARNRGSSYERDALEQMTEDEVKVYNYYYATEGKEKAREYLDFLVSTFQERRADETALKAAQFANKHPFAASALSIGTSLDSGFEYIGDVLEYAGDKFIDGKDVKLGMNENALATNAIRQTVADKVDWEIGNWDAFDFVYNTTMSGLDSAASIGFGGMGGTVLGLSAAAQATNEALDRGMSDGQAFWNGLASGVFEGLFESWSIGKFKSLQETAINVGLKNIDKDIVKTITKNIGKSMLVNASEESLTEIANILYDTIINGEFANYTLEDLGNGAWKEALAQVIEAGASGAFMGLGFGAVGSAFAHRSGVKSANEQAVKQYGEFTDDLINEGLESDQNSESYRLAQKYQQQVHGYTDKKGKQVEGKALSGNQIRNLVAANETQFKVEDFNEARNQAKDRLTELGENASEVWPLAELVAKKVTGQELTRAEKRKLVNSFGSKVAHDMENPTVETQSGTRAYNATYKSITERTGEKRQYNVAEDGKAKVQESGNAFDLSKATVTDIKKDKRTGKVTDVTFMADGKEVQASGIEFADESQSFLVEAVSNMENITPKDATAIIHDVVDTTKPLGEQLNGIDQAFNYGFWDYSVNDLQAGEFVGSLSTQQMMSAYALGKAARRDSNLAKDAPVVKMRTAWEAKMSAEQKAAQQKANFESDDVQVYFLDKKSGAVTKFDGSQTYEGQDNKAGVVRAAQIMSKLKLGGSGYYFYESYVGADGVRYYKDENGVEKKAHNGIYRERDGRIYIDLNAGNEGQGVGIFTLGHELTHFIKHRSEAQFKKLGDLVTEAYGKTDKSMDQRVLEKQALLKQARNGADVSYTEAYEEVLCDAMSTMISDGNFFEKVAEIRVKDKGLFNTMKRFFKNLFAKFNAYFKDLSPEQQDAIDIREMKDMFDRIQTAFAEAVVEASDNFQAQQEMGAEMSNEEAFMDSETAIHNQIRPPYSDGSKAFNQFVDELNPEARKTFDLFYGFYQKSRITNTLSVSGKKVKAVNISSLYLLADEWNDMLSREQKWADAAKALADFLPENVRKRMNMNEDGSLNPTMLEKEFKMPSSMAQRLVDALAYEKIDATYQLGNKTITLPTVESRQSVGGEAYRRAIIDETRKLFAEGKLKKVGIGTMSKDRWGSLGFLAANGKTGASGDFTTVCPQMMFNRGCWYCYRRAAMEKGVNNKLVANSVWYTGEILRIKDSDIEALNRNGGLRIQSFGDWMPHFSAMLADVLYDAELRGLQVKIITKEPSMINYIAALREQGIGKNLYFNLSADYTIERGPARQAKSPDSLDTVNPERPYLRNTDNGFWWKRAMTVEEANKYRQKYPWVNTRIVATTMDEFIRGLQDSRVDVVTGYHGNIREFERVDSTTGEHKVNVEALGDAGMPRFAFNPATGKWVTEYEGKTQTHKRLAQAIAENNLQMEYYTKTCCITGRCATCEGKCGALARDFNVKNATNRDSESIAYWQKQMQYAIEPEFGDMTVDEDVKYSERKSDFTSEAVKMSTRLDPKKVKAEDVLDLVQRAAYEFDEGTYIPVRISTPPILIDRVTAHSKGEFIPMNLPMIMEVGKIRQATEEDDGIFYEKNRPHGISEVGMVEIFKGMGDPAYIVFQKNGRYAEIVRYKDKTGKTALASVDFYGLGDKVKYKYAQYMNGYEGGLYNVVVTTYNPDDLQSYLDDPDNVIIYDKKKGLPEVGSGSKLPSHLTDKPFYEDIVTQPTPKVNNDSEKKSERVTTKDSTGKELTEAQQEFFADSKVRDKDGNLLVMYHGSSSSEKFTVFESRPMVNGKIYGDGYYFTEMKNEAQNWGSGQLYKVYVDLKNPYYVSDQGEVPEGIVAAARENSGRTYDKLSQNPNWWGSKMSREEYIDSNSRMWRNPDIALISAVDESGIPDGSEAEYYGEIARRKTELLKSLGYDGVIVATNRAKRNFREVVAFDSEQIKLTTNKKPTADKDIRYSERVSNKELAQADDTALYIKNTDKADYIGMIFNGAKTEETRSRRTLDAFIGKDFYVTDGKYVYGSIVLGEPHQYTEAEFHQKKNQLKHRVPVGDEYDIKPGGTKWAYPIESYKKFDKPKKLSDSKEYKNSFQARQVKFAESTTSNRDRDYLAAVKNGDMETAQRMVDEAAKKAGYNSPLLYHGTKSFGFTKFDPVFSDDKRSLFATSSNDIAQTYSGEYGAKAVHTRSELVSAESVTDEDVKNALDTSWQTAEIAKGKDIVKYVAEALNSQIDDLSRRIAMNNRMAQYYDYISPFHMSDEYSEALTFFQASSDVKRIDKIASIFSHDKLKAEWGDNGDLFSLGLKIGKIASAVHDDVVFALHAPNYPVVDIVDRPTAVQIAVENLNKGKASGNYALYANTNGLLEVDGHGRSWNSINFKHNGNVYNKTRDIAELAYTEGYKGVRFKNILDNGPHGASARSGDVYVFFDSNQLKSADPVTYDADGKVIPLSQRFNEENDDIRYSERTNAPVFYSKMAKVIEGMKQEKFGASSVISMLRDPKRGVKAEEIRWSGIQAFLDGKKSVTKAELLDFIKGSMLHIEERDRSETVEYTREQKLKLDDLSYELERLWDSVDQYWYGLFGDWLPIEAFSTNGGTRTIRAKVMRSGESETNDGKKLLQLADEIDSADQQIDAIAREAKKGSKLANWKEYSLDGGSNYRELLFKIPGVPYSNDAMRAHWGYDAHGILAHARMQDFETLTGVMLFIEEIQSDWHNEGHRVGYRGEATKKTEELQKFKAQRDEVEDAIIALDEKHDAFLTRLWEENLSEAEYDQELRTYRGEMSDLISKKTLLNRKIKGLESAIEASPPDAPFKNNYHEYVLKRLIRMAAEEGYDSIGWTTADLQMERWNPGRQTNAQMGIADAKNPDAVAFEEGYNIEYDKEIPKFLRKYGKQWGAEVGKTLINEGKGYNFDEDGELSDDWLLADEEFESGDFAFKDALTYNGTEVWTMRITDAMKKSVLEEGQELYSERTGHSVSNRALLANAFEGLSQNSNEYKLIQQYKGHIAELNSLEDKLSEFRHEIRKLRFGKDEERDAQKLARLESDAKKIAEAINKHDKKILSLEASEPLRKIIEHERKKESEKTRAHVKEIQQNKKVRAEQAELRHKIRKTIRDLDKILKHGNKQKNVKEDLQGVVTKALKAADILFTDSYSTYDMLRNGLGVDLSDSEEALVKTCTQMLKDIDKMPTDGYDSWQARQEAESKLSTKMSKLKDVFARERKRLNNTTVSSILGELADAYKSLEESEQSYVKGAYMEPVYEFLKNLQSEVGGAIVQDMTKAQLESVYAAYKMVLTTVRKANELFNNGIKMSREQLGNAVIEEVMKAGGTHGLWTKGEIARSRASWNNMKPIWVANRIGSESFGKLMQGLFEGQYNFAVDIDEAKRFKLDMDKKYKPRSWDKDKLYEFESSTGRKFSLNLQQIMSLYAFSKREQAYSHLLSGGFVYEANSTVVVDKNGIKRTYLHDGATSYKLNEATLNEIIGTLTSEQKAYVDEMQAYLSDVMGAKGNEVSMKLYGIQLFKEKFYFPLRSSGAYMERAKEAEMKKQQGQINLVNSGFTHAVKPQAKNPIILSGFMDVWAEHCNEMSMYHSMVLPMEDFRKVYNYSTVHDESYDSASVYQSIQDAYGKAATDYIDQLYRELNAGATVDPRETPFKAFISKFKKASVMMSASVVVQQFSSVGRAYALIDPKYFIGAKVDSETKLSAADEMKKYAPVAIIKEMGGFDTGTKGSAKNYILAEVYGKGERLKGLKTDEQYRSDLMGFMPAKADEITWCAIWEAVKRETKAKHKNMDVKSEEFLKLAGERFSEVIEKTQVYDSVLARSANMRSKGAFMNMATAFMAEPTTTINLLEDALRGRSTKKIARAFGAVAASIVLNNALASVVYAMRDDDEDETLLEKYFQSFTSGMIDDLNPMSYYPFYKDVYSLFQGYDVERADMSVIADLRDALKKAVSVMGKDTDSMNEEQLAEHYKSVNEILLNLLDAGCSAFGVPMKNVRRDVNGMINAYTTISKDVTERDNSWLSFWDKVGSAAKDTIPVLAWTKDTAKADKLYDAIISGDKEYLARMKSGYKDESTYASAVRKALRENDPRIQEAANAKYNGNTNEYKRIFKEIQNEGKFSFDDIMSAINTELSKLSPDKATSNYSASGYVEAIALGNTSNAQAMKDDIIATKMANGQTLAEAEKAFASDVATGIKNAYSAGLLTEARAEEMLVEYAGKDEEDAASKVSYWAFCEKNPKYKDILTEGNVEDFHEFAEPAGISLDVYAQFVTGTKGLATIYDDWGDELKSKREQVLEVIDSLPLTWQQKDALYLAAGYSENKIMDVPW